ncbi:MAG: phosphoglucosamine mutase [Desulfurococcales archaeon]|nr:phosphoglucosamine mutase [Desulfurococcales archaeon]
MAKLFGTDGVRGIIGEKLTPEMALRLGRAIGAYFGKGSRILVGRDIRSGGAMIKRAVISGLLAEGIKVYDADLIPTPGLQYNVKTLGFDGGVMITASHNPPEYNGIKVIAGDGVEIPHEDEEIIESYYFQNHASRLEWRSYVNDPLFRADAIENYVEAIVSQVDKEKIASAGFKVVIECANSVGSLVTPKVLSRLGVKYASLNCNLDPLFPGREPEPSPITLKPAIALLREISADLIIGHDGDADRAIIGDDKGRILWGDRDGALLSAYVAEKHPELPRRVYTGVSSSIVVEDYLRPRGIEVIWTPVGSVTISRMIIRDGGAISGFEENGGYMHTPHQIVRDGAMKTALLLEMLAEYNTKLSSLVDELPVYYTIKTKIPASREEALCAVEKTAEAFKQYRLVTIDGVKVIGDDFWLLVRPSGTEPVVRIMAEARIKEKVEDIVSKARTIVEECKKR